MEQKSRFLNSMQICKMKLFQFEVAVNLTLSLSKINLPEFIIHEFINLQKWKLKQSRKLCKAQSSKFSYYDNLVHLFTLPACPPDHQRWWILMSLWTNVSVFYWSFASFVTRPSKVLCCQIVPFKGCLDYFNNKPFEYFTQHLNQIHFVQRQGHCSWTCPNPKTGTRK